MVSRTVTDEAFAILSSPLPPSLKVTLPAVLIALIPSALPVVVPTRYMPLMPLSVEAPLTITKYIPSAVSCLYPLLFAETFDVSKLTSPDVFETRVSILPFWVLRLVFVVERLLFVVERFDATVVILVSNSLIAAIAFCAVVFSVAVPTLPDTVDNVLDNVLIALCRVDRTVSRADALATSA